MKSIKEIKAMYSLHHTAAARGYVSRKSEGIAEEYHGRFGDGFVICTPRWDTTNYYWRSYYTVKK